MKFIHLLIVSLSTVVVQTTVNGDKKEREQTADTGVVEEFEMGKTTWGSFVDPISCEQGSRVSGFRLRVQAKQGLLKDDSALNGIQLACTNGKVTGQIVGVFGTWKEWVYCSGKLQNDSSKFVVGFNFRSESIQWFGDGTGGNNIKVQCNDGNELDGGGLDWGTWHSAKYTKCAFDFYLCGVQSRIEPNQGEGDDTGMNQIKFQCCGKELQNLAIGKAAKQSSTYPPASPSWDYKAENAVDGNLKTISTTNNDIGWWRVDLGKPAIIYKVRVYDSYGGFGFATLKYTTVTIGNNVDGESMTSCGRFTLEGGQYRREDHWAYDVTCATSLVGRYIQVNKDYSKIFFPQDLYMEEFEAYGRYIYM